MSINHTLDANQARSRLRFWAGDLRQTRIMRYAFGVALTVAIAYGFDWPLAFLLPILTALFLSLPMPSPTLKSVSRNMLQTLGAFMVGAIFTIFLLPYPLVYVPLLGLCLFHIYYLANRGGSFWLVIMLLLAVLLLPMLGNTSEGLALGLATGFVGTGWLTVGMILFMHTLIPDPPGGPAMPPQHGPKRGYSAPAAQAALKSTIVVLPMATLFLVFDFVGQLLVMVFAAIFSLQPELSKGRQAGMDSLTSTLIGGIAAFIVYRLIYAVPEYHFFIIVILLVSLLFGQQIFSGRPNARYYGSALIAMLVLVNGSLGSEESVTSNLVIRLTFISLAVLYVISSLRVVERYWPVKKEL